MFVLVHPLFKTASRLNSRQSAPIEPVLGIGMPSNANIWPRLIPKGARGCNTSDNAQRYQKSSTHVDCHAATLDVDTCSCRQVIFCSGCK